MTVSRESDPPIRRGLPRTLAMLGASRSADSGTDGVRPLIAAHRRVFPNADADLLRRAYAVADRWHGGQTRKSGAPYITHPLAVAILLAEIGMDTTTLVAALLHDTVEDTGLSIGEVKAEFGAEVAVLVDGVTKLDGSRWGDHAEAETFRKMIVAASIDLRVLVIKLADRVHNLRTLAFHPKRENRERIARASMELLVPFAQRLGLYDYQREMEDLSFANLAPEKYARVRAMVQATAPARDAALAGVVAGARAELAAVGLRAKVEVRGRHLFSIHRELPGATGASAAAGALRPTDTARVVVVVDGTESDCYVALGALHGRWRPVEDRFRDYISMPKYNMYRSLHTAVLAGGADYAGYGGDGHGEGDDLVGVLIRTPAMDRIATYGVADRIREAGGKDGRVSADMARQADLDWLNRLIDWQPLADAADFLDGLRADLGNGGIVVFTPGRNTGQAPGRRHRRRFRVRGLAGDRGHRRRGARQREAQGDGEPTVARPGRRPDYRPLRRPAGLLADRGPKRPGAHPSEGRHRRPPGRRGRRPRPRPGRGRRRHRRGRPTRPARRRGRRHRFQRRPPPRLPRPRRPL